MKIFYAKEEIPNIIEQSIFLAGPTPRRDEVQSWRPEALGFLEKKGYNGIVFVPEPRDGKWHGDYIGQVEWEDKCLNIADCIVFWLPRELSKMPAFTTNDEWGFWKNTGKCVIGIPKNADKVEYQRYYAKKYQVPIFETLEETLDSALLKVKQGSRREGGEKEVPLYIWNTPSFQAWHQAQKKAGNRLDGAKVEWTFRVGPQKNFVFFWILHVNVYIQSEKRNKINEVVLARPDIAVVVMYKKEEIFNKSHVVLIREFRSPASTNDGFIREAPGGSSFKPNKSPLILASDEAFEETGLRIGSERFRQIESRQLTSTLSSHKAHLFSVAVTDEELQWLHSQKDIPHGVLADTERTYVEIYTIEELLNSQSVDWSMLGMIMRALI